MWKKSDFLGQILTHGPSQNTIFFALTQMKEEGLYSEIIRECLKALSIYPDDVRIRNLLAESYLEIGFISLAEEELIKVASEIEKLASAYMLQARIYKQQNRPEKAVESLKIYLALNPEDQEAIDLYEKITSTETSTTLEVTTPEQLETKQVEESTEEAQEAKLPEEELEIEAEIEAEIETVEPTREEEPLKYMAESESEENESSKEEEEIVDLATPTLAELYFSQGQTQEAIETYKKILLNNPEDEESEQRLDELKASLDTEAESQLSEDDGGDIFQEKTEKSIAILEGWLAQLQEKTRSPNV